MAVLFVGYLTFDLVERVVRSRGAARRATIAEPEPPATPIPVDVDATNRPARVISGALLVALGVALVVVGLVLAAR